MPREQRRISSHGELYADRVLDRDPANPDRYAPGQHHVKVLDPSSKRDRSDLGAFLTWVDDDGLVCCVICERSRETGEWQGYGHRHGMRRAEDHPLVFLGDGELRVLAEATADVLPFPHAEPTADELAMRRIGQRLVERVFPEAASGGESA